MKANRYAARVGAFVGLGLLLIAGLVLTFSKGLNLFTPSFRLEMRANSVAGLKKGANVLLAGVPIGTVEGADITPDGRSVLIHLRVQSKYQQRIHADARFVIEQVGFLGDQYVAIYPRENKAPTVRPGQELPVEEPLNFQEIARSGSDLVQQLNKAVKVVNEALARLDRTILSEKTLTNATAAVQNFRQVSERAMVLADGVGEMITSNSLPISLSISNLVRFSEDMDKLAAEMSQVVATNRVELTQAVKSLGAVTRVLQVVAEDVEQGKGLAGALFKDQQLKIDISGVSSNLVVLTSNLNKYGLLYKPRRVKPVVPPQYPGPTPFK